MYLFTSYAAYKCWHVASEVCDIANSYGCVQVCSGNDNNFVVINQKGIDPPSLDLLARAGVSCGPLMRLVSYYWFIN